METHFGVVFNMWPTSQSRVDSLLSCDMLAQGEGVVLKSPHMACFDRQTENLHSSHEDTAYATAEGYG